MITSRKSLVSSSTSHSLASIPGTPRSRADSKILVDGSVDELFVQYSVPQIQRLQREYKSNLSQAKDDLHRLVGEKYRDLIRIAEDIDEMSVLSHEIDSQLTNLSYKSSSFVEFGKNASSNFDSAIRKERARKSRVSSHKTILNNVINNKLIGYDLKLQTDSVKKTSTLVSVAKLYFTISVVFANTLKTNPHVSANLYQLRNNFIRYLENKISMISSPLADFGPQGLNIQNFFVDNIEAALLESDNFELFTGSFDEDEQEFSDDDEHDASQTSFRGSSYPIVNFLIAYIIVNHDDPKLNTLEKVTNKFIDLRYNFLDRFVTEALESGRNNGKIINFSMIFQYIESTCAHMYKYFVSDDLIANDLQSQLKYIVTWKASEIIGFHNWFDEETVEFDNSSYQVLNAEAVAGVQLQLLKFGKFVYQLASKLVFEPHAGSITQKASKVLNLFYDFVLGLRKSEVIFLFNTTECHSIKLISAENAVSKLLGDVVEAYESCFSAHEASLATSDTSVLRQITIDMCKESSLSSVVELFTPDFVNLIDVDVDKYFDMVVEISSSTNTTSNLEKEGNSCLQLKHWFFVLQDLLEATNPSSDNSLQRISRLLNKDFKEVDGVSKCWGDFNAGVFLSTFENVRRKQIDSAKNELKSFINKIASAITDTIAVDGSNKLHFLLDLYIILKDNIGIVEADPTSSSLDKDVGQQVLNIYKQIFDDLISHVPEGISSEIGTLIKESACSPGPESVVPTRPHLTIHSLMFELAFSLLQSPRFRQHEMCNLYTDPGVKDKFIAEKNRWIRVELIENVIVSQLRVLQKEHTNEEVDKSEAESDLIEEDGEEKNEKESEDDTEKEVIIQETEVETFDNDAWDNGDGDAWDEHVESTDASPTPGVEVNEEVAKDDKENTTKVGKPPTEVEEKPIEVVKIETEEVELNEVESNGEAEVKAAQAAQTLANILFLLNFTAEGNIANSDVTFQSIISSIEEICSLKLEHSTVEIILRGVNEFYRSSKDMYLPLLVN